VNDPAPPPYKGTHLTERGRRVSPPYYRRPPSFVYPARRASEPVVPRQPAGNANEQKRAKNHPFGGCAVRPGLLPFAFGDPAEGNEDDG
jgi:hypothetical protein